MRIAFIAVAVGLAVVGITACDPRSGGNPSDTGRPRPTSELLPATQYDTTSTGQVTTAPVTMEAKCQQYDVQFALRPWKLKTSPGANVRFNVNAAMGKVEIYAKDPARWPFEGASPLVVTAGSGSPTGARIRADADSGAYSYGIRFDCTANGKSDPIDVDPDIIVLQ